ncbi:ABC transporter [Lactobacillus plantarum] [Lactiplantibacillus mudanjiangensis]|uniref:ABC transporter ATP-binding protein n=1 Tax=Lactiplantibacillus mudanjiangensis TaxID=1296538 RepID=UPI001014A0C2|nr:ATP-binding cassette domain-containing protein [Lactiplantibacillus mudanjiangensis]VDG31351.1 ABC transporter [Lactobacillus plantarum] [Lactiplantibacillus mudanjiangensis]
MSEAILTIKNVSKRFGHYQALSELSLTVNRRDIYGLIGENGAGKTTLMRLIIGLSALHQGQITLLGENAGHYQQALRRTGAIIESPAAFPGLTVLQNLTLTAKQHGLAEPDLIAETIAFVGLTEKTHTKAKHLSLGQRQRLGLAIAILPRPDFLILDEPINGLDPAGIIEFRQLIARLNTERHTTILIASHILSELYQVATRFGIIHHGHLIKQLSKAELDEANRVGLMITVDQVQLASQTLDQAGFETFSVLDDHRIWLPQAHPDTGHINQLLVSQGIVVTALIQQSGSLEQYYTTLIAKEDNTHA